MSNDLISRKAAIKAVKTIIQAGLPEEAIYAELEEIPTAYDVDAVCEEISDPNNYTIMAGKRYTTIERAIEIVRNGGKKK